MESSLHCLDERFTAVNQAATSHPPRTDAKETDANDCGGASNNRPHAHMAPSVMDQFRKTRGEERTHRIQRLQGENGGKFSLLNYCLARMDEPDECAPEDGLVGRVA